MRRAGTCACCCGRLRVRRSRLPALAKELVDAPAQVIVAINTPGARAAIQATKHIPIVMAIVGDPVAVGVGFGLWHTQNRVFALWRDHPEALCFNIAGLYRTATRWHVLCGALAHCIESSALADPLSRGELES